MASWSEFTYKDSIVRYCSVDEHPTADCSDFPDCTGFFVWRYACYTLCRFLIRNKDIYTDKNVIELGAGVALPSAVVARDAAFVLATDAQPPLLAYGNANILANSRAKHTALACESCKTHGIAGDNADIFGEEGGVITSIPVAREDCVLLPHAAKLTWTNSKDLQHIIENFGKNTFDLVLASDVLWLRTYSDDNIYEQARQLLSTLEVVMSAEGLMLMTYNMRLDGMTTDIFTAARELHLHIVYADEVIPMDDCTGAGGGVMAEDTLGYAGVRMVLIAKNSAALHQFIDKYHIKARTSIIEKEDSPPSRSRKASGAEVLEMLGLPPSAGFTNPLWKSHVKPAKT